MANIDYKFTSYTYQGNTCYYISKYTYQNKTIPLYVVTPDKILSKNLVINEFSIYQFVNDNQSDFSESTLSFFVSKLEQQIQVSYLDDHTIIPGMATSGGFSDKLDILVKKDPFSGSMNLGDFQSTYSVFSIDVLDKKNVGQEYNTYYAYLDTPYPVSSWPSPSSNFGNVNPMAISNTRPGFYKLDDTYMDTESDKLNTYIDNEIENEYPFPKFDVHMCAIMYPRTSNAMQISATPKQILSNLDLLIPYADQGVEGEVDENADPPEDLTQNIPIPISRDIVNNNQFFRYKVISNSSGTWNTCKDIGRNR